MKIIKHRSIKALNNSANHYKLEVFETPICFYFYIFKNKMATEFHAFFK